MKTIEKATLPTFDGYNEVNGTYYRTDFPAPVVQILERARANGRQVRIYYGDSLTGKDWNETYDIKGTVGRSTGPCKVPLLIKAGKSGGGEISDSIVRIRYADSDQNLYIHPTYSCGKIEVQESNEKGYSHSVLIDGKVYSNHKTQRGAHLLAAKLL